MKGAFIVTGDDRLFDKAAELLTSRGARYAEDGGAVQIEGPGDDVFTLYDSAEPEWEFRSGPFRAAAGVTVPDMSKVTGLAVECNSERFFAEITREIAGLSNESSWALDGDGVVWDASEVDPEKVRL